MEASSFSYKHENTIRWRDLSAWQPRHSSGAIWAIW